VQGATLVRCGHPGADFFGESCQEVAGVFESRVDAAVSDVGVIQPGGAGESGGNVGRGDLDGASIGQVAL
jgi:hypothetical protein